MARSSSPSLFTASAYLLGQSRDKSRGLIAGRYPPEQAPDLILGRQTHIKSVTAFAAEMT
jgi:hypothetical protein